MTGSKEMSVGPIKQYFQPNQEWLVKERCSKKYHVGWPGQPADGVKDCTSTAKPTTQGNSAYAIQNCPLEFLLSLTGLLHLMALM